MVYIVVYFLIVNLNFHIFHLFYLKKLNLKYEGTQQFKLNIFRANSTVANLVHVKVEIESLSNTESIFVKCYVKDI